MKKYELPNRWEKDFESSWNELMKDRMKGSKYLAKQFYLLGRNKQRIIDSKSCKGCFGTV